MWKIFLFILLCTFVSLAVMLNLKWADVKKETLTKLSYTSGLVQISMEAVLKHQQTVLSVLGMRAQELLDAGNREQAQRLIDQMLENNPALVGFGLTDLQGNYEVVSSNLETMTLPNLLEQPQSAVSFRQTLESEDIVLGRTYFFPPSGRWVIPARLRLKSEEGEIIGVMTTGFVYGTENSPWNRDILPEHVILNVIREENGLFYRQFQSDVPIEVLSEWVDRPVDSAIVESFGKDLVASNEVTIERLKESGELYLLETRIRNGIAVLGTAQYDPVLKLFTITYQPMQTLYALLVPSLVWLVVVAVAFNLALYLLFQGYIRSQRSSRRALEFQANHDALTELPNRHYLSQLDMRWSGEETGKAALLFIDLKNFKAANDFYGHRIGDELLKIVAQRLKESFDGDTLVRMGGDEFIVLSRDRTKEDLVARIGGFLNHLNETIEIENIDFNLDASIGISQSPEDGGELGELLRKADLAMYECKHTGNRYTFFTRELDEKNQRRHQIESELPNGFKDREFSLVYQPQIDARTRRLVGLETLVRWNNATLGFVPPDEFIGVAESTGIIHELGAYVIDQSLKEVNEICAKLSMDQKRSLLIGETLSLAINVSVQQLFQEGFAEQVRESMKRAKDRPFSLMIEITESLFINDVARAKRILESFQAQGVSVSLDDFGTGYSSLSILSQLPINELKIDKSFVRNITTDQPARNLIQSIISLGKSLSIPVLAEGVEDAEEVELLCQYGCDIFQGYYFSRPLNQTQLIEFLENYSPH